MGEPIPQFVIIDDGTLDTVFECRKCERRERYNYPGAQRWLKQWGCAPLADFSAFRNHCLTSLEDTHLCSTD